MRLVRRAHRAETAPTPAETASGRPFGSNCTRLELPRNPVPCNTGSLLLQRRLPVITDWLVCGAHRRPNQIRGHGDEIVTDNVKAVGAGPNPFSHSPNEVNRRAPR